MGVERRWLRDLIGRLDPTVVVAAFVPLVVVWVFLYRGTDCDLDIYYRYAQTGRAGSIEGLYTAHDVEYPPAAVLLFLGTDVVSRALPDCTFLGALSEKYQTPDPSLNFRVAYRLEMCLVALAVLVGLLVLLRNWQAGDTRRDRCERVLTFVFGLALLSRVAFDRLDLLLSALVLLALGLLVRGRRPAWSLPVLALAAVFKVVPIALAPIWVIGCIPTALLANRAAPGGWRRLLLGVSGRGLALAGLVLLMFLPFYALVGSRALVFFTYHKDRGIEIESTYAAALGTLKHAAGHAVAVEGGHGGCDLVSPLTPTLTQMAPLILGGLLLGAIGVFLATLLRATPAVSAAPTTNEPPSHLASAHPGLFAGFLTVFVLVFLLANKVFSPQFVLWLLPLAPLVPLARRSRRFFQAGFLGVCLATHFIYPRFLEKSLYGRVPGSDVCTGPTLFGTFLLDARTLLLLALLVGLTVQLVRSVSGAAGEKKSRRVLPAWPALPSRRSA